MLKKLRIFFLRNPKTWLPDGEYPADNRLPEVGFRALANKKISFKSLWSTLLFNHLNHPFIILCTKLPWLDHKYNITARDNQESYRMRGAIYGDFKFLNCFKLWPWWLLDLGVRDGERGWGHLYQCQASCTNKLSQNISYLVKFGTTWEWKVNWKNKSCRAQGKRNSSKI